MTTRKKMPMTVLVCDDSRLHRLAIHKLLATAPEVGTVIEAEDGAAALKVLERRPVDIIMMDVMMPGLDGLETTRRIMATRPTPILIASELVGKQATLNFKAMEAGALEVIHKPSADDLASERYLRRFVRRLRVLSEVPRVTRRRGQRPERPAPGKTIAPVVPARQRQVELVAIGASTGGPPALQSLLSVSKRPPPWPVVVVQHMSQGFIAGMVDWLSRGTGHDLRVVDQVMALEPGIFYVAPDDRHLVIDDRYCRPNGGRARRGHKPSVDVLFESIAEAGHPKRTAAFLLTGMGNDGAEAMRTLREQGAYTVAQDEASSVIYGMPRAAANLGAAQEILSLGDIGEALVALGWNR